MNSLKVEKPKLTPYLSKTEGEGGGELQVRYRSGLPCFCSLIVKVTANDLFTTQWCWLILNLLAWRICIYMKTGGDNVFEGRAYAFTFYSFDMIYRFQLSEGEGGVEGSRNPATLTAGVTVIADCWQMVLPCGWRRCGSPSIDVWQISEEIDKRACLFFVLLKSKRIQIPSVPLRPVRTC